MGCLDSDYQRTIIVSANIEDRTFSVRIGVRITLPGFSQIFPSRFFGHAIPDIKRIFRLREFVPKLDQSFSADNMHGNEHPNWMLPIWQHGVKQ